MHHVPLRVIHVCLTLMEANRTANFQHFNLYAVENSSTLLFLLHTYAYAIQRISIEVYLFYGKCH